MYGISSGKVGNGAHALGLELYWEIYGRIGGTYSRKSGCDWPKLLVPLVGAVVVLVFKQRILGKISN